MFSAAFTADDVSGRRRRLLRNNSTSGEHKQLLESTGYCQHEGSIHWIAHDLYQTCYERCFSPLIFVLNSEEGRIASPFFIQWNFNATSLCK